MNRYVIEGLLKDLVYRNKQIVFAAPAEADYQAIRDQMLDELHSYRWSYSLQRATEGLIEFRGGGRIDFTSMLSPFSLSGLRGRRPDVWVVHGLRSMSWAKADPAWEAIRRQAAGNNAEIIQLD